MSGLFYTPNKGVSMGFIGTPGPWSVVDEHPERVCVDIHGRNQSAWVTVYRIDECADHNARLIAAAPDLLEALQLAKHVVENLLPANSTSRKRVLELSNAAIAKAIGEE